MRLATGKVEIGQGILTALTQIAAEELDVAPQRLRIVSGETTTSPAEGFTSGSNSIAIGGAAIRLACAEVRALFLRHAADKLACAVEELSIDDGRFLRRGQATGLDYWSIAGEVDLDRPATGDAPTKPPSDYRVVGQEPSAPRLAAKLKGAAFIHDIAPDERAARPHAAPALAGRAACRRSMQAAVTRAAGGAIEILREGDLVAFTRMTRSRSCAHRTPRALTRRGKAAQGRRPTRASPSGSCASPRAPASSRPGRFKAPLATAWWRRAIRGRS